MTAGDDEKHAISILSIVKQNGVTGNVQSKGPGHANKLELGKL